MNIHSKEVGLSYRLGVVRGAVREEKRMPPKKRSRKEAELEEEYESYTNDQLREALQQAGKNPGPIDAANRKLYVNQLVKTQTVTETSPSPVVLASPEKTYKKSKISPGASLVRTPLSTSKLSSPAASYSPVAPYSPTLTAEPKPKSFDVTKIEGLVAATFTPFTAEGEVNLRAIRSYADFLLKQGVNAIFVNGTTGEGVSLTDEERKQIAKEWLKVAGKRMTVIIHVGSMSLKSTCDLAIHAEESGAAAIGIMPPSYIKPPSLDALIMYLQKVGEAAPNTPMFYYHIPIMTGVKFSMEDLLQAAATDIPTLRGLKFTDENLMEFTRCVACNKGSYPVMYGRDEQVLASLVMGGKAAVGSTYNYCGRLNNRLFKYFKDGDLKSALIEQRRADDAIVILRKYSNIAGGVGAGKAILKAKGFDIGPPRLPLLPLSVDDYSSLVKDLRSIGFFDWS